MAIFPRHSVDELAFNVASQLVEGTANELFCATAFDRVLPPERAVNIPAYPVEKMVVRIVFAAESLVLGIKLATPSTLSKLFCFALEVIRIEPVLTGVSITS